jgi:site-specific recombinase XerD
LYPHCLRATAATNLAYEGISAASLQYDFGWERLSSAEAYVKSDMKRAHKETQEIYDNAE